MFYDFLITTNQHEVKQREVVKGCELRFSACSAAGMRNF